MEVLGFITGGLYSERLMGGTLRPSGIIGFLEVRLPESLSGEARNVRVGHVICYRNTPLQALYTVTGERIDIRIDIDSVKACCVPMACKSLTHDEVYGRWRWIEHLGETKGAEANNRESIEELGLYGYYFDNTVEAINYAAERMELVDRKAPYSYDPMISIVRDGNIWFAGFAFSRCESCNKWCGKEVIQAVGETMFYKCLSCNEDVDFTITKDVFTSHRTVQHRDPKTGRMKYQPEGFVKDANRQLSSWAQTNSLPLSKNFYWNEDEEMEKEEKEEDKKEKEDRNEWVKGVNRSTRECRKRLELRLGSGMDVDAHYDRLGLYPI